MNAIKYKIKKTISMSNINGINICINTKTEEEQLELIKELESLGVDVRPKYKRIGYSRIRKILWTFYNY